LEFALCVCVGSEPARAHKCAYRACTRFAVKVKLFITSNFFSQLDLSLTAEQRA